MLRRRIFASLITGSLLLGACAKPTLSTTAAPLLLPTLAAQEQDIHGLTVIAPGDSVQVRLLRRDGLWRVAERADWLADPVQVDSLLASLAALRGAEPKTIDPALYARLGLAPITEPEGTGIQLRIEGAGAAQRVLVGIDQPGSGHTYVRVDGQAQTWLADRALLVPREPGDWLEHSLVEIPLLRISAVAVYAADTPHFTLEKTSDGFRMHTEGVELATDTERAEAMASLLAPLSLEDLARDEGAPAERELQFRTVDGLRVDVQAWRRAGRVWFRLAAAVDAERAAAWAQQSSRAGAAADVQERAERLTARTHGYAFLMPSYPSSLLMLGREQLLAKKK